MGTIELSYALTRLAEKQQDSWKKDARLVIKYFHNAPSSRTPQARVAINLKRQYGSGGIVVQAQTLQDFSRGYYGIHREDNTITFFPGMSGKDRPPEYVLKFDPASLEPVSLGVWVDIPWFKLLFIRLSKYKFTPLFA